MPVAADSRMRSPVAWPTACPCSNASWPQGEAIGFRFGHALVVANLGEARLLAGDGDQAQRHADRALALARDAGERGWEAWTLRLHGNIAARRGLLDDARAHYLSALAVAERHGMRPLIAHCHRGLGAVLRSDHCEEDARSHLATAAGMYREMDMRFAVDMEAQRDATA